ncbi:MAG: right-handed parallel beta-helix repeat-containing protein [Solirubrobacterales bacterium]
MNANEPILPPGLKRALAGTLSALALLATPAVASAADRWVDADTGSDSANNCKAEAQPCATISQAVFSAAVNGDYGTIHVDQGTYPGTLNVGGWSELVADDFVPGDSGTAKIVGSGSGVALFVSASASAKGFTIESPATSTVAMASDQAKLLDNHVTAEAANSTAILAHSGTPTITGNTVTAASGDEDYGIQSYGGASSTISGNEIGAAGDGFAFGIALQSGASADIGGNTILGGHPDGRISGAGIKLSGPQQVVMHGNRIAEPSSATGETSSGIYVENVPADGSITSSHNIVEDATNIGFVAADARGPVTLDNDLIVGTKDRSLYAGNVDSLTIANTTIAGEQYLDIGGTNAKIDSSIIDDPVLANAGSTCEITYSRGEAATGSQGCDGFQTAADPGFADPAAGDYHLTADSPLIDAGDPAAPAGGAVDIDGDPRAIEGDGVCPIDAERDMGADEVVAPDLDCHVDPPPPPVDTTAPETTAAGAKKQRGHRGRFTLSSSEEGSTFECRLDRGAYAPCVAELKTRRLNLGRHTLFVRATDAAGNTDPTPYAKKFKLKRQRRSGGAR